jgi:murein DD-endopeptidase MepM/ murein hydrolase activator NlpD
VRFVRPSLLLVLGIATCAGAPVAHRSRALEDAWNGRSGPAPDETARPVARSAEDEAGLTPNPTAIVRRNRVVDGVVVPYPVDRVFRGFARCRRGVHTHQAIDIGGVGRDAGIGTPIVSMANAEVVFLGKGAEDPDKFGPPDTRSKTVVRGRHTLPASLKVAGYGTVHLFTRQHGSWRTGNLIVTRALDGPLKDHVIRYMHLGAIHPKLALGTVLEAGQELGLMGGTGVQESAPHVHIDVEAPDGHRLDVAPLLGLPPSAAPCSGPSARVWARRAPVECGPWRISEDFKSGKFVAHEVEVAVVPGQEIAVSVTRTHGEYTPVLAARDADGRLLCDGHWVSGRARKAGIKVKQASREKLVLEGHKETSFTLRIEADPTPKTQAHSAAGEALPPRDGAYQLTIERTCAAH